MTVLEDLGWKARLRAWWEGYDLSGLPRSRRKKHTLQGVLEEQEDDVGGRISAFWSAERIEVYEQIFGTGNTTPTTPEHVAALIKPLGLDQSKSVLDIGAGLGGVTRRMARETGAWLTGLEADAVLAYAGMRRSTKAGLEKKATVEMADLETPEITKRYDAIFSKEALFRVKNKEEHFQAIATALKSRGHLCFTDYVLRHSQRPHDAVRSWLAEEEPRPYLWSVAQVTDQLHIRQFDTRIAEDISETHRSMIMSAWTTLPEPLVQRGRQNSDIQQIIVAEAERWMRLAAALDSGDLRVFRFYAIGP